MKLSFGVGSMLLFGLSVVLLVVFTVFESALVGMSLQGERLITLLGLVLPAGVGAVLGAVSLSRKEGQRGLAVLGVMLNSLFALFHLMIIFFAG